MIPASNLPYRSLEEAIKKESDVYRIALQTDLCAALWNHHWVTVDQVKVKPLTSVNLGDLDPVANYYFPVRDEWRNLYCGYIFPFRRAAIADLSYFIEAMKDVLFPQGYDVFRYTHHRARAMSSPRTLINFLGQEPPYNLRREERVSHELSA